MYGSFCAYGCDPFPHRLGDELSAIVGADMAGDTTQYKEIGQDVDHIDRLEFAIDADCQALVGELVDDVERAVPYKHTHKASQLFAELCVGISGG